ncbi:hypothetical protein H8356DRAFT_1345224 [Neocallimastix lanati (nom. inval.)]|nr:hypothetical protein H8356DRAFT_1345224 [Neocallimastix sp. JGI-2020a]
MILSYQLFRLSPGSLLYRFDSDLSLSQTNNERHSLYAAFYDGLLFRRNNYTNPLTDQFNCTGILTMTKEKSTSLDRSRNLMCISTNGNIWIKEKINEVNYTKIINK